MTLINYIPILLAAACAGLWLSLSTEQSQIVAKTKNALAGRIATGYMRAMQIMILNRLGTIIYTLCLSLSIEIGISNQKLLMVSMFSCCGVFIYNLFLLLRRRNILKFNGSEADYSISKILFHQKIYILLAVYSATLLNVLGLTIPMLLSNSIPDYRLTLSNTGFLLNTGFTLVNVLIIERNFARLIDVRAHGDTYIFVTSVFTMRLTALFTALAVLSLFYVYW